MKILRNRETGEYPIYQDQADHRIRSTTSCQAEIPYADFGYDVVFPAPAPAFDPITQYAQEIAPVLTPLGTYRQAWEILSLSPEEKLLKQQQANSAAALLVRQTADIDALLITKEDAITKYLVSHTPQECAAYVQTTVTDLAQAKVMLAKFAMILSVLSRRELR